MSEMEDRNQVVRAASEAGFDLSGDRLGRLHRGGAIPEPTIVRRGRKGTRSLYPAGTTALVLRLLESRERRKLRELSWQTWWEHGGDFPPAARAFCVQTAKDFDRVAHILGRLLDRETESEIDEQRMDKLYSYTQKMRVSGPLAAARRRVGKSSFSSVTRVFTEIGTGRFTGYPEGDTDVDGSPLPGTVAALVEKALGLDRARTDVLADAAPWYSGSSEADLTKLSSLLVKRPLVELAQEPGESLDEARREFRSFVVVISTTASLAQRFLGRNAFGFGLFARILAWKRPGNQAMMLLGWICLRGDPELKKGMGELVALEPRVEAWVGLQRVLDDLRSEIPAYGAVLTDRRIGRALRSSTEAAQLASELAILRTENLSDVKAFLKRHSEIDALVAITEAVDQQKPAS
jgi:hypothetical protein